MAGMHPPLAGRTAAFAAALRRAGAARSDAVTRALAAVPRHRCLDGFYGADGRWVIVDQDGPVPGAVLDEVYSDTALVTQLSAEGVPVSSSSQPSLVARMLEALRLAPGLRVLEVGAGTGWNAALLATITGAPVVTVDAGAAAAARATASVARLGLDGLVRVVLGDGWAGVPDGTPYDRVVATVGCAGVSPAWLEQLAPDGFALVPVDHGGANPILAVPADGTTGRLLLWAGFMRAGGPLGWRPPGRHDPDVLAPERPVTGSARAGPPLDHAGYLSLWCFLAGTDRRTTRVSMPARRGGIGGLALLDPARGVVWLGSDGMATTTGDPALLDEIAVLVAAWEGAGRPGPGGWSCRLLPAGDPDRPVLVPDPASWTLTQRSGPTGTPSARPLPFG